MEHIDHVGVGMGAGMQDVDAQVLRAERERIREERRGALDLMKAAPRFYMTEDTWEVFYHQFMNATRVCQVNEETFKIVLFNSLKGQALALACPDYAPQEPPYREMTGRDYALALQELFEPASETEQIRIEFKTRYQLPGEHPALYYRDKLRLFMRAYAPNMRDWMHFYDETISGLINQEMRRELRHFIPEPVSNHQAFKEQLQFNANVIRRRLIAGEIATSEALGAEAHQSNVSYRVSKQYTRDVKSEMINAIGRQNKPAGICWHCGEKDHYAGSCPRKASGLPAVTAIQPEEEEETVQYVRPRPAGRPTTTRPTTNRPTTTGKPFRPWIKRNPTNQSGTRRPFRNNPRVMMVYEDEEGKMCTEELPEEVEEVLHELEQEGELDQINTLSPEYEDGSNDDEYGESSDNELVPKAFLGL